MQKSEIINFLNISPAFQEVRPKLKREVIINFPGKGQEKIFGSSLFGHRPSPLSINPSGHGIVRRGIG